MATKTYASLTGSANNKSKQGQLRTSGRKIEMPTQQAGGIYDKHPSPGLSSYPATVGGNDLHMKFAETGVGEISSNQTRTNSTKQGLPRIPTSSNMNKKKNRYANAGKTKQF